MNYEDIVNDKKIHDLHSYNPDEKIYVKYALDNPNLIAACFKIDDVYSALCNARAMMIYSHCQNFGELSASDEFSKLYIKSHLLICAILECGLCLDLSWQVIWAYLVPLSLEDLNKKEYVKMEKYCTREDLTKQSKVCIFTDKNPDSQAQKIYDIMNKFDNDKNTLEVRTLYNKIKHQGTIHFEGLGCNNESHTIMLNGYTVPLLKRDSYKMEEIEELLYTYYENFRNYMNKLIEIIVPDDYFEKISIDEHLSKIIEIIKKSKKS